MAIILDDPHTLPGAEPNPLTAEQPAAFRATATEAQFQAGGEGDDLSGARGIVIGLLITAVAAAVVGVAVLVWRAGPDLLQGFTLLR